MVPGLLPETILKPAQEVFWGGYSGYFADPDGHVWEVAYNPHWKLDGVRVEAGQEHFIPKGTRISGKVTAGTRTVHAFGGRRAARRG
jgi:hypothetical protein